MHQRALALLVSLTLVFAACTSSSSNDGAGDGDAQSTVEPTVTGQGQGDGAGGEPDSSVVVGGVPDSGADESPTQGLVPAEGQVLFPCVIAELDTSSVSLVYAEAGDAGGLNGDRFRAVLDDYQDRCGGAIEIVSVNLANLDGCSRATNAGADLVVTDSASIDQVSCLLDAGPAPVWHEAGLASVGLVAVDAATAGRVLGTDMPRDVAAAAAVSAMAGEGLLAGASVVVVRGDSAESAAIAGGFTTALEATAGAAVAEQVVPEGAVAEEAAAAGSCGDGSSGADIVVAVVAATCLRDLVQGTGTSPIWVLAGDNTLFAEGTGDQLAPIAGQLDGALAYQALPATGGGWPRGLDPHARDDACNRFLDILVGTSTPYPGASWSAGARTCATAHGVLRLLAAADGTDAQALVSAAPTVNDVLLPRGLLGAMDVDAPWLAGAAVYGLEWSADCLCWNYATGPMPVQ